MSRVLQVLIAATLACATPVLAETSCKLMKVAEWTVKPQTGRLIIDGTINGQPVGVLLNTGANSSRLMRATAARLGLTRHEALGYRVYGTGGESHAEYSVIDEFKVGQAARRNWRVLVVGDEHARREFGVVLGYDFFEQLDVEFDLANNAVRLFKNEDCGDRPLAYWARGTLDEVKLEVDHEIPAIRVPVKLNGKAIVAELHSGIARSLVSQLLAAQLGVTPDTPGTIGGDSRTDESIGAFDSFVIGGEIIRNPSISLTELRLNSGAETGSRFATRREIADMLLGVDFLRAHRVYVAHSQGKLYLSYSGGPVFSTPPRQPAKPAPKPDI